MSELTSIRAAEGKVELAQGALSAIQTGLEAAEAAEEIVSGGRAIAKTALRVVVVLGLVSLVLYLIKRKREPSDD